MNSNINIKKISTHVQDIKLQAEALIKLSNDFPALNRNLSRIQASLKMLELNITDLHNLSLLD
jgi:hypothetical protein